MPFRADRRPVWLLVLTLVLLAAVRPWPSWAIGRAAGPGSDPAAAPASLTVGALLNLDPQGDADTQAAVALAVDDVNRYFAGGASPMAVSLRREGTGLQPAAALAGLRRLAAAGVKVVVGPESSAELEAIREEAARAGVVLISHCSTAPSLAVAGDTVFRLVPDDTRQAAAIAGLIEAAGIKAVAQIFRDDVFGRVLSLASTRELNRRGITVAGGVPFVADSGDPRLAVVAAGEAVRGAVAAYGREQVAVQLFAFGPDVAAVFDAAVADPNLKSVRWFGSDGTAQSVELIQNPAATRFALGVGGLPSPLFAAAESEKAERVRRQVRDISGTPPQVCAMTAYDAVWLAALTAHAVGGTDDTAAFARALPQTADLYFGASGWTALNAAGDREAADYDVWAVSDQDGTPAWRRVGRTSVGAAPPTK